MYNIILVHRSSGNGRSGIVYFMRTIPTFLPENVLRYDAHKVKFGTLH